MVAFDVGLVGVERSVFVKWRDREGILPQDLKETSVHKYQVGYKNARDDLDDHDRG